MNLALLSSVQLENGESVVVEAVLLDLLWVPAKIIGVSFYLPRSNTSIINMIFNKLSGPEPLTCESEGKRTTTATIQLLDQVEKMLLPELSTVFKCHSTLIKVFLLRPAGFFFHLVSSWRKFGKKKLAVSEPTTALSLKCWFKPGNSDRGKYHVQYHLLSLPVRTRLF